MIEEKAMVRPTNDPLLPTRKPEEPKVLYNTYYDTYDKFRKACFDFFDRTADYDSELRSLLTNNFQIIQA